MAVNSAEIGSLSNFETGFQQVPFAHFFFLTLSQYCNETLLISTGCRKDSRKHTWHSHQRPFN